MNFYGNFFLKKEQSKALKLISVSYISIYMKQFTHTLFFFGEHAIKLFFFLVNMESNI